MSHGAPFQPIAISTSPVPRRPSNIGRLRRRSPHNRPGKVRTLGLLTRLREKTTIASCHIPANAPSIRVINELGSVNRLQHFVHLWRGTLQLLGRFFCLAERHSAIETQLLVKTFRSAALQLHAPAPKTQRPAFLTTYKSHPTKSANFPAPGLEYVAAACSTHCAPKA